MTERIKEQLQSTLGDSYTIERELGRGGMSKVFRATETALGRTVVIKTIAPELAEGISAERFTREVKLAALGDADHGMQWLETSLRKKTASLRWFLNWNCPYFANVKNDPRFVELRRQVLATTFKT